MPTQESSDEIMKKNTDTLQSQEQSNILQDFLRPTDWAKRCVIPDV